MADVTQARSRDGPGQKVVANLPELTFSRKQPLLIIASIGTAMPALYGQVNTTGVTKSPAEDTAVKLPAYDVVSVRQKYRGLFSTKLIARIRLADGHGNSVHSWRETGAERLLDLVFV